MPLPIESITDEKYGLKDVPFRVYYPKEGKGLEQYARPDFRQGIVFDGTNIPVIYLQLAKNPLTHKFVPYALYYRTDNYPTDESVLSNPNLPDIAEKCSWCQSSNRVAEAIGEPEESPKEALQVIQKPVQPAPGVQYMDLGGVITPSVIPAVVDVVTKVLCEPAGEALVKIGVAGLASIAAGWAKEGGTQAAWRKISEDIIRNYKVCPTDIPKIQDNVVTIYNAMQKDRANVLGALQAGTIKNFGKIAKEHGFELKAQGAVAAKVSVAPFRRTHGGAID